MGPEGLQLQAAPSTFQLPGGHASVAEAERLCITPYRAQPFGRVGPAPPETGMSKTGVFRDAGPVQHVTWLGTDALLVAHSAGSGRDPGGMSESGEWLQEIHSNGSGTLPSFRLMLHSKVFLPSALTGRCAVPGDVVRLNGAVLTLTEDPSSSEPAAALIQLQDGSVLRYHTEGGLAALPSWACFRSPCQQVAATPDAALQAAGAIRKAGFLVLAPVPVAHQAPSRLSGVAHVCGFARR